MKLTFYITDHKKITKLKNLSRLFMKLPSIGLAKKFVQLFPQDVMGNLKLSGQPNITNFLQLGILSGDST